MGKGEGTFRGGGGVHAPFSTTSQKSAHSFFKVGHLHLHDIHLRSLAGAELYLDTLNDCFHISPATVDNQDIQSQ